MHALVSWHVYECYVATFSAFFSGDPLYLGMHLSWTAWPTHITCAHQTALSSSAWHALHVLLVEHADVRLISMIYCIELTPHPNASAVVACGRKRKVTALPGSVPIACSMSGIEAEDISTSFTVMST